MPIIARAKYGHTRALRATNKSYYRVLHWPLWIFVFFLVPGPLVANLFAGHANRWNLLWLALVLAGTGLAACRGQLPGTEREPYILRFTEDRPNPLYRRICYALCWNAVMNFALTNLLGLMLAVLTGKWYVDAIYSRFYFPVLAIVLLCGLAGRLPRTGASTAGEGTERRHFYGLVWTVTLAQASLLLTWKGLPHNHATDIGKLALYVAVLLGVGTAAAYGLLPRTQTILPGELVLAD